jgi:RNA polymerase sigma-70 factor (ECF subfamily)
MVAPRQIQDGIADVIMRTGRVGGKPWLVSLRCAAVDREQILSRLRERIVAFAASQLSRDLAEDLAQDVLVLLHEKYSHVTVLEELVPLSFQILRFKMWEMRRKAVRRGEYNQVSVDDMEVADTALRVDVEVEHKQLLERLLHAIEGMRPRCRRLFLWKLEGKDFREIQRLFGVSSINTIYTWDLRCRNELRHLLKQEKNT